MQINEIASLLVSVDQDANVGISVADLDNNANSGLPTCRKYPAPELKSTKAIVADIQLLAGLYPSTVIKDLENLAIEFHGFTGICPKSSRRFWQYSPYEVASMLLAGNSKQTVASWLSNELTKRIAPEWVTTSPEQLDKLSVNDPVGYLLYVMGHGLRASNVYADNKPLAMLYTKLDSQADVNKVMVAAENLRRLLSWASVGNVEKHGNYRITKSLLEAAANVGLLDVNKWLAGIVDNCLKALTVILKHMQKIKVIGKEFKPADVYNIRETMEGYSALYLQRKRNFKSASSAALVELLTTIATELDIDFNRANLRARGVQAGYLDSNGTKLGAASTGKQAIISLAPPQEQKRFKSGFKLKIASKGE